MKSLNLQKTAQYPYKWLVEIYLPPNEGDIERSIWEIAYEQGGVSIFDVIEGADENPLFADIVSRPIVGDNTEYYFQSAGDSDAAFMNITHTLIAWSIPRSEVGRYEWDGRRYLYRDGWDISGGHFRDPPETSNIHREDWPAVEPYTPEPEVEFEEDEDV